MSEESGDGFWSHLWDGFLSLIDIRPKGELKKAPTAWIKSCVKALFLFVVFPYLVPRIWTWLTTTIGTYPAQIGFALVLLVGAIFVQMWIHQRGIAKIALKDAHERGVKIVELESRIKALQPSLDPLANREEGKRIISFLFKCKEGTIEEIVHALGMQHGPTMGVILALLHDFQMVDEGAKTADLQQTYILNARGLEYAKEQRMEPGNSHSGDIRASEAEKELVVVRERLSKAEQECAKLRRQKENAENALDTMRKNTPITQWMGLPPQIPIPPPERK